MNARIYIVQGVVFAASLAALWLVPAGELVKVMFASPGVAALVAALLQATRDSVEFERQKQLQEDQQIFGLGANSHMSKIAFDKHVDFCEAYMREVHEAVGTLFREGPTQKGMDCAQRLFQIKRDFAAWIPRSVAVALEPFENALHMIGAKAHLASSLGVEDRETRSKAIDESYQLFSNVLGLEKLRNTDPDHKQELAIENVKEQVRSILGINDLVDVRTFIMRRSAEYVRKNS